MKTIESGQFRKWMAKLKDNTARGLIIARINRLIEGLPGDTASVGGSISELRIHYGPGYRVYFTRRGTALLILLCAGNKSTQKRDIVMAHQILKEWSN